VTTLNVVSFVVCGHKKILEEAMKASEKAK
jgi:hypothetical protein